MTPLAPSFLPALKTDNTTTQGFYIGDFKALAPTYRSAQAELLDWLADAHALDGKMDRSLIRNLLQRYSGSMDRIAFRSHALADFTHHDWDRMRLFGPQGSTLKQKTDFFNEVSNSSFQTFYAEETAPPDALLHVTCTGYSAPSAAQRLVSTRRWGQHTEVLHAYHMGCYAAHPALRMAMGQLNFSSSREKTADIVHTELCSLHFDPTRHDPEQFVIQSLFADGFMKYSLKAGGFPNLPSFQIIMQHEEIVPESAEAMNWTPGPFIFAMTLSKDVPVLFAGALPGFLERLFEKADLNFLSEKSKAIFAIHPGGPRIIDLAEKILNLEAPQTVASRHVLREHGNMSSATLPSIWQEILFDENVPEGTLIVSIGAGPGLTISGALFRKNSPHK